MIYYNYLIIIVKDYYNYSVIIFCYDKLNLLKNSVDQFNPIGWKFFLLDEKNSIGLNWSTEF